MGNIDPRLLMVNGGDLYIPCIGVCFLMMERSRVLHDIDCEGELETGAILMPEQR